MTHMVIVGAGESGVRAAFALRELGHDGKITLVGAEATLPYERPPLSKGGVLTLKAIREEHAYELAGIGFLRGLTALSLDTARRTIALSDGSTLAYDRLLIATGARPRLFPGMDECRTLRTDKDAEAILEEIGHGKRVGIIGGGFIGLELAATAREAGADVTVLEAAPQLMGRAVPAEIASVMEEKHRDMGVDIRLGAQVAHADRRSITLKDGTRLAFDIVVAGVGAVPNVELAESAGIETANGIVVDGHLRTSVPDVFAAGDCCSFPYRGNHLRLESWRAAQDQGAHAAASMLGREGTYDKVPWFWSDQYDMSLQLAGMFGPGGETVRRDLGNGAFVLFHLDGQGMLHAAAGVGQGNAVAKDIRLAEMLIERHARPDRAALADPSVNLKQLLKSA